MDEIIKKIPKVGKIYKSIDEAYGALLKGFRSITKREPNAIENQMIQEEAKNKIQAQGDNISILDDYKDQGIKSLESGTKKPIDELEDYTISDEDVVQNLVDQKFGKGYFDNVDDIPTKPDLDRPFVTDEEMSAFTMEQNAKKLNKAKGFIDKLGAKSTRQKLFVADLVEDAGEGIFDNVDMGAVVRSNMFDDLIEQGIDDDLLTKIMYSDTKSDDFATTLAKIKSNVADESIDIAPGTGVDVNETIDFYGRVFDEVARVKKAMGGRIGYAEGNDDPKKKSFIKKIPKVGKVVSGLESLKGAIGKIKTKFGDKFITTADRAPQPEKTVQQQIMEFEARNKKPDAVSMDSRKILDVPEVPAGFSLSKEKLLEAFPEIDADMADEIMQLDKDTQGRVIMMLKNRRQDPEAYDKLLETKGDTLEFQGEFDKVTRRKNNQSGGLNYLMGL
jgi:hypothetical protein